MQKDSKTRTNHATIVQTGVTCKKIPLQKSIEFGMALKQSATCYT